MTRRGPLIAFFAMVAFCFCAVWGRGGAPAAYADDGFYFQKFNPIQQGQLDGALAALEQFGLDRVLLVPDPADLSTLELRLRLLGVAVASDPRFVLPSLDDLRQLSQGGPREWRRFWSKYPPLRGQLRQMFDRVPPIQKFESIAGSSIWMLTPQAQLPQGVSSRHVVRVKTEPDQSFRFAQNPAMGEILLPQAVAEIIRDERLYGHDGSRGFYSLPQSLIRMLDNEQRLNDRIENTTVFNSIKKNTLPPEFLPENRPVFPIYHLDLPASEVTVWAAQEMKKNGAIALGNSRTIRFFVHPQSKALFDELLGPRTWHQKYWATPTASHRSLVVWNPTDEGEQPVVIKTSLDARIGTVRRTLSQSQIERAFAARALISTLDPRELEKLGIVFIDEPYSVIANQAQMGFTLRTLPEAAPGAELVPMFSLYSKSLGARPRIQEMVEAARVQTTEGPLEFIERTILSPLMRIYSWLALHQGLVGEMHEQNVLIEVRQGQPTGRFFFRDLAGFIIQPRIREDNGLGMSFLPEGLSQESLKFNRANPVGNAITFLKQSNFYALQKALVTQYPEVTQKWIDERFRAGLKLELERYLQWRTMQHSGKNLNIHLSDNMREWQSMLRSFKVPAGQTDCSSSFGDMERWVR